MSDDWKSQDDELTDNSKSDQQLESTSTLMENSQSKSLEVTSNSDNESNRLNRNCLPEDKETALSTNEVASQAAEVEKLPSITYKAANNDSSSANELRERPNNEMKEEMLVNRKVDRSDSSNKDASSSSSSSTTPPRPSSPVSNDETTRSRSITPKSVENVAIREDQNHESLSNSKSSSSTSLSKRKYTAKGTKFVREPTPGPDLNSSTGPESETKVHDLTQGLEKIDLSNDTKTIDTKFTDVCDDKVIKDDQVSSKFGMKAAMCNRVNKEVIEATNEDSGFENSFARMPTN